MRKSLFLTLVFSLCIADFGAFAANARGGGRGTSSDGNQQQAAAPVAARAAARTKSVANKSAPAQNVGAGVKASPAGNAPANKERAGKKQTVAKPMAARAGATQKVIQTGQKVAAAATNTTVPQECQDAFFGCMDSFCMLDNASGGRCQCNDRIVELDKALEDILKLDEQTYIMATEGVERLQMGEAEAQIMARAKAAADKVTLDDKKAKDAATTKNKIKQLDLSAWNKSIFDEEEDVFGSAEEEDPNVIDTFADKKGNELYKSAAKMCVDIVPDQCKQYGSMVQLVYAQKIKSDCVAYENSLKQQRNASQQKLQTAQKALRDAALNEYKDQNKYGTAGECAVAFAQCMQNDAGCGSDYTGCVTLAAKENVKNNKSGTKAKQTTIKGAVAGANITLAASTMESLLAKKEICQKVVKQCVTANEKQDVWTIFLRNAAPALKSAEEVAEQNLRMQCIPTLAECFKTACKSQIDPNDKEGSYDMCLANPKTYKSLCKVQLEPCLEATGGTYDEPDSSSLWNGLIAALKAMKVDACTNQVKTCITDRCGDDYAGCVGLETDKIGELCPIDKLTACVSNGEYADGKGGTNTTKIRAYIAEIAQGLAVQIDNSLLTVCQKAANDSMMKVCGDTETCDALAKDEKLGTRSLKYKVCNVDNPDTCRESFEALSQEEVKSGNWTGIISGEVFWGNVDYDFETGKFTDLEKYTQSLGASYSSLGAAGQKEIEDAYNNEVSQLVSAVNNAFSAIEADPTVTYCMTGREVQGFDSSKIGRKKKKVTTKDAAGKEQTETINEDAARFPNLTAQMKDIIVVYALKAAREKYQEKYDETTERMLKEEIDLAAKRDSMEAARLAKWRCKQLGEADSWFKDKKNREAIQRGEETDGTGHRTVDKKYYKATITTMFNEATGVCTKETISQNCAKTKSSGCKHWEDAKTTTETFKLM